MTVDIKMINDTPIVWAHDSLYAAGDEVGGTRTQDIAMTGLLATTARAGNTVDLGATRAERYAITVSADFATAPAAGETVDLYWGPSLGSGAILGNQGGLDGTEGAYVGTAADTLANSLKQLIFLGSLVATIDATTVIQSQTFVMAPPLRYGQPVVVNSSAADNFSSAGTGLYVRMEPIVPQAQDAV